ncbi:putative secreted effector protein [Erysiphe neolycopersici]|uniref:Putative secreted effector protein n=1 Tax=Erysiphe neolycopersici TaxID=212602 RepID=A0A420HTD1_9PEZI|nr:putative secreted effector protein [Erysiphe neolycopersici]
MLRIISIGFVTLFIFALALSASSHSDLETRSFGRPRSLSHNKYSVHTRSIGRSRASIRSRSLLRSRARLLNRATPKLDDDNSPLAYKCVLNRYDQKQILDSRDESCKYINDGKQTKGISRWPQNYKPPNPNQFAFQSNVFKLWPLEGDGEVFKGSIFKKDFNNFVVTDANCQLAGVVVLFESKGAEGKKVKEYKNCETLSKDGTPIDPTSPKGKTKDLVGAEKDTEDDLGDEDEPGAGAGAGVGVGTTPGAIPATFQGLAQGNLPGTVPGRAVQGVGGAAPVTLVGSGVGTGVGAGAVPGVGGAAPVTLVGSGVGTGVGAGGAAPEVLVGGGAGTGVGAGGATPGVLVGGGAVPGAGGAAPVTLAGGGAGTGVGGGLNTAPGQVGGGEVLSGVSDGAFL